MVKKNWKIIPNFLTVLDKLKMIKQKKEYASQHVVNSHWVFTPWCIISVCSKIDERACRECKVAARSPSEHVTILTTCCSIIHNNATLVWQKLRDWKRVAVSSQKDATQMGYIEKRSCHMIKIYLSHVDVKKGTPRLDKNFPWFNGGHSNWYNFFPHVFFEKYSRRW
jgi:hypothetical protein